MGGGGFERREGFFAGEDGEERLVESL